MSTNQTWVEGGLGDTSGWTKPGLEIRTNELNDALGKSASDALSPFLVLAENNAKDNIPNVDTPLNIPTYDALGETTHPCALYFPNGWNGYKFWLCHTPYPNGDNQKENPSIVASNDNVTWAEPAPNPVAPLIIDHVGDFNSDGHIFMRDNVMELWYRTATSDTDVRIFRKTTTDGVNWTAREFLFDVQSFDLVRSPAIRYINGKYCMWYNKNVGSVYTTNYAESADGKVWTNKRELSIPLDVNYYFWHIDAIVTNGKYELTLHCYTKTGGNTAIFYTSSFDNVNYSRAVKIMEPTFGQGKHDSGQLYKASAVKVDEEYYLYYGSISATNAYKVGLVKGFTPLTLGLNGSKEVVRTVTTASNAYFAADVIDKFPKNQITLTKIFSASNGFPTTTGMLYTDNTFPEKGHQKQTYKCFDTKEIYTRYVQVSDGNWSSWFLSTSRINVTSSNFYNASTTLATFPSNTITYTKILAGNTAGLPDGLPGLLITDKVSDPGFSKQFYRISGEPTEYVRTSNVDGTWGAFVNRETRILKSEGQKLITGSSIPANGSADKTVTLPNVAAGDVVIGTPTVALEAGLLYNIYVTAANTVTVRVFNVTASAVTMADKNWNFTVIKKGIV